MSRLTQKCKLVSIERTWIGDCSDAFRKIFEPDEKDISENVQRNNRNSPKEPKNVNSSWLQPEFTPIELADDWNTCSIDELDDRQTEAQSKQVLALISSYRAKNVHDTSLFGESYSPLFLC